MPTLPAEPPKNPLHRFVDIEAVFGSEIQRDVAMKVLGELLAAWKSSVESSHTRNKVTITVPPVAIN